MLDVIRGEEGSSLGSSRYKRIRRNRELEATHLARGKVVAFLTSLITLLFALGLASAQTTGTPKPVQSTGTQKTTTVSAQSIEILIQPSRSQPIAGTGIGFIAEIKNQSESVIYLKQKGVTLTLPPELETPFQIWPKWAIFPTESPPGKGADPWDKSIAIRPGGTYAVLWSYCGRPGNAEGCNGAQSKGWPPLWMRNVKNQIWSELNFLPFLPGDYKITVVVKYWTDPGKPDNYYTATQSATMNFAAPQSVIMLGAMLGGLIAYLILPQIRGEMIKSTGVKGWISQVGGGIIAVLLSAMITILLSRLAGTTFLIRISINDFWGAVTTGFLAIYSGAKYLERIAKSAGANGDSARKEQGGHAAPKGPAPKPGSPARKESPMDAGAPEKPAPEQALRASKEGDKANG
jgi:hypothetical protein